MKGSFERAKSINPELRVTNGPFPIHAFRSDARCQFRRREDRGQMFCDARYDHDPGNLAM
jgi:hypothetical protein